MDISDCNARPRPQGMQLVTTPDALDDLAARVGACDWVALDSEFVRERTYLAQPCLLQLATPQWLAVVDVVALSDIDPLLAALERPGLTKVLHAARQDLELLYERRGRVPSDIHDTQIAAAFLGLGDQLGLAGLVQALCGIELDKSQVRTDWSRRPLAPEALAYAADDVRYLVAVHPVLQARLAGDPRAAWVAEECAALSDARLYRNDPESAWRALKGLVRLEAPAQHRARRLAAWREVRARERNLPRRWILGDGVLLEMCRRVPDDVADLERFRDLPPAVRRRDGEALVRLLHEAPAEADLPLLAPVEDARYQQLAARVEARARELGIPRMWLATRGDVEGWLRGEPDCRLRQGWRHQQLGSLLDAA